MPQIRSYRPADEAALAWICGRTADAGNDATGLLAYDQIWARRFVLPSLEHHPGFASGVTVAV